MLLNAATAQTQQLLYCTVCCATLTAAAWPGCVDFLAEADARAAGLAGVNDAGQVYMRTDNTTMNPVDAGGHRTARRSVRVSSKRAFDPKTLSGGTNESGKIMFVLDVAHMPTGCAVWPSWWMNSVLGNWPEQGEVDLIEVSQCCTSA